MFPGKAFWNNLFGGVQRKVAETTSLRTMFGEDTCILFDSPHLNPTYLSNLNLSCITFSHKLAHSTLKFSENFIKFNKAKFKVLHLGQGNYQFLYNLVDELIGVKDLGVKD